MSVQAVASTERSPLLNGSVSERGKALAAQRDKEADPISKKAKVFSVAGAAIGLLGAQLGAEFGIFFSVVALGFFGTSLAYFSQVIKIVKSYNKQINELAKSNTSQV